MIIYISMIGVLALVYLFHMARMNGHNILYRNRATRAEAFFIFGYIIFWIGMRNSFADTAAYISSFQSASLSDLQNLDFTVGSGWGFIVIQSLFKTFISSDYHAWLLFIAVISGGCLSAMLRIYSTNYFHSVFLFLASTSFTWMMNGIRQFLAVAILLACTPLLEHRKCVKYLLVVLLCSTIHGSALIMIPAYFLVQGKPWKLKTLLPIVGVVLVFAYTAEFTELLDFLLEDTFYANAVDQFIEDDGVNPLRVLVAAVPVVLAFIGRKRLASEHNPVINICVNMAILTLSLYAVGVVTSGILIGRLPVYMQMYTLVSLPIIIDLCFTKSSRKALYILSIAGYTVYFMLMSKGFYYSNDFTGRIY